MVIVLLPSKVLLLLLRLLPPATQVRGLGWADDCDFFTLRGGGEQKLNPTPAPQ